MVYIRIDQNLGELRKPKLNIYICTNLSNMDDKPHFACNYHIPAESERGRELKRELSLKRCISVLVLCLMFHQAYGQKKSSAGEDPWPDPHLSQKDNNYIDRQDEVFLDTISAILKAYPPVIKEGCERAHAKLLMDAVFHDQYAAFREPSVKFYQSHVEKIISDLERVKADRGAVIWKVYNMGFIVRTKSVTLAFDLVSGITSQSKVFAMSAEQVDRIVRQCDILFISHKHSDHAEKFVAERFLSLGLPVIAPEQVWKDDKIYRKITHLERNPDISHKLRLSNDRTLDVVIYPGHQMSQTDVNVALVRTSEGISVAHMGDQINEGDFMIDFAWIDNVYRKQQVDILMPNCWTNDIVRIVRGFRPQIVMPGHQLELGHSVWDRLPFWGDNDYRGLSYTELKKSEYPVLVMVWGESFHYLPKSGR